MTEPQPEIRVLAEELLPIGDLKPHPRNYQEHPEDQIEHLRASIRQYGVFRNVVIARDNTILAGHGITEAALLEGVTMMPTKRVDLDPDDPEAIKLVVLDNEVGHLAIRHDRPMSELLRTVRDEALNGLLGTGYDDQMLAALVMVTRPAHEIEGQDAANEWLGMPDYEPAPDVWRVIIQFNSEDDRRRFLETFDNVRENVTFVKMTPRAISGWWPPPTEMKNDGGLRWVQDVDAEKDPEELRTSADWG